MGIEILMHLRSLKKVKKDISIHEPIGADKEGNELSLLEILQDEDPDIAEALHLKMEKRQIYECIHVLNEREREVVVGRFGLGEDEERTQREIARELGISRSYVSRIEKRALLKLFQAFYRKQRGQEKGREDKD